MAQVFHCDGPECPSWREVSGSAPGWYHLQCSELINRQEFDFCSAKCLSSWSVGRAR